MIFPDLSTLPSKTRAELALIKPIAVYTNEDSLIYFGLAMSNGEMKLSHANAKTSHRLPENIKTIVMVFNKGEFYFHTMTFYGDTIVRIGHSAEWDEA